MQSSQNDQYGGQSIGAFDVAMAEGVRKSFRKTLREQIKQWVFFSEYAITKNMLDYVMESIKEDNCKYSDDTNPTWAEDHKNSTTAIFNALKGFDIKYNDAFKIYLTVCNIIKEETHQAMESFLFNMNTLHSRSGAQTVFSSINYGLDTSPEGRLVIREILNVTNEGMGSGETMIFPVQIFGLKEGVNYNPEDINYDLFKYSMKVSAKRLYPNYLNVDASFNLPYYNPSDYRTWPVSMGLTALPFEPFDKWVSYMMYNISMANG